MFQSYPRVWTISDLLVRQQKLRYDVSRGFSSKARDYKPPDSLQDTPVSQLLDEAATYSEVTSTKWVTTPYAATAGISQEDMELRKPKINPSDTSVMLFPGQGVIKVGQVREYMRFPRVKELFEIANEMLGYNLLKMCLKGPQIMLDRTEYNQPATVVMSLAALEKLKEERPKAIESCAAVAGYSVGELTALIFTGALPYEEGIKLVGVRATAMQTASELSPQGMLSCYCSPTAKPGKICEEAQKWAMDIGASNPLCRYILYKPLCVYSIIGMI